MKTIIRNGMELFETRPGVYKSRFGNGVEYVESRPGEIIKARRQELKITQQELADRIGVNIGTVSRYESGKIDPIPTDRREAIAEALKCTKDYLLGRVDDPHENFETPIITADEEDLIELFRYLSPDQRAAILTMMKGMVK